MKNKQVKDEGLMLINGEHSSSINAMDRGLHYGDGVFRTLKVVSGQIRWWEDHFRKLAEDCAALGIPCPEEAVLHREVTQLASESGVGVMKIMVTRGVGQRGYAAQSDITPTRIVMGFTPLARQNQDVRVRWCDLRLAHQPKLAGIKHLNRLENILARSEWDDADIAEGLLMDEADQVICGTMTNLFIVDQGRLVTPDLSLSGIAGVTRGRVMRAAMRHGQQVSVEKISPEQLLAADEVLLCNSLVDIWRVAELDEKLWPDSGWAEKLRNWLDENN